MSEFITEQGITRTLISALLGGLGAIIGFGVYTIIKKKTLIFKIISLIGLIGFCVGVIVLTDNLAKPTYQTCDICGYKAIKPKDIECQLCGSETWEKVKGSEIYDTKEAWIKHEQLFMFHVAKANQKIEFYEPEIDDGYEKDINWRPTITEKEIRDDFAKD